MSHMDTVLADIKKLKKYDHKGYGYKKCINSITKKVHQSPAVLEMETEDGCTLFEEAIYEGLDATDLLTLLSLFIEHGMDINYRSSMYGDTYMHALIEADDYDGLLSRFLYIGYENDFDPFLKNHKGKTVWDCLEYPETSKKLQARDVQLCFELKSLFEERKIQCQLLEIQSKRTEIEDKLQLILQEQKELESKLGLVSLDFRKSKIKQKIDDLNA